MQAGPPPNPETIRPVCGLRQTPVRFAGDAVSMTQLASALGAPAGRIVFDRTGLSGYFDVDLEWAQSQDDPLAPPIFTAIREQLGLRLEGSRAPVEMIVVVSAEPPAAN